MFVFMSGLAMGGCSRGENEPEFSYETIIVQLTVEASDAATLSGHVFTPADFPEVALSEVRLPRGPDGPIPTPLGMRMFLFLTLENPGRDNVLNAVNALNGRSDVYRADLSYAAYGT